MKLIIPHIAKSVGLENFVTTNTIAISHTIVALAITLIISLCFKRYLKRYTNNITPPKRPSFCGLIEALGEFLFKFMENIIGKNARVYFPLIASTFLFILICNLMGIIPGIAPPTADINLNLACSLTIFCYYNYIGIKSQGLLRYLKHLAGPIIWIAPLIFIVEIISNVIRPISLSIRLFGNMAGDHMVLDIFSQISPLLVPIPFMILTVFVAFIQAFVFTLLSIIYISLAEGFKKEEA